MTRQPAEFAVTVPANLEKILAKWAEFHGHVLTPAAAAGTGHTRHFVMRPVDAAQRAETVLSPIELNVIAAVGDGLSNREIARRLFLAEDTVKVHLRRATAKVGAKSRTDLYMKALRAGVAR